MKAIKYGGNEKDFIEGATVAYARRCAAKGWVFQPPKSGYSRVEGDVVILENLRGVLARYEIYADPNLHLRLRWMDGRYVTRYPRPARCGGLRRPR